MPLFLGSPHVLDSPPFSSSLPPPYHRGSPGVASLLASYQLLPPSPSPYPLPPPFLLGCQLSLRRVESMSATLFVCPLPHRVLSSFSMPRSVLSHLLPPCSCSFPRTSCRFSLISLARASPYPLPALHRRSAAPVTTPSLLPFTPPSPNCVSPPSPPIECLGGAEMARVCQIERDPFPAPLSLALPPGVDGREGGGEEAAGEQRRGLGREDLPATESSQSNSPQGNQVGSDIGNVPHPRLIPPPPLSLQSSGGRLGLLREFSTSRSSSPPWTWPSPGKAPLPSPPS